MGSFIYLVSNLFSYILQQMYHFDIWELKGTLGNSGELKGIFGNSRKLKGNTWELKGTLGNSRELMGTHGNIRKHLRTQVNTWELKETQGNSRGTFENSREHL